MAKKDYTPGKFLAFDDFLLVEVIDGVPISTFTVFSADRERKRHTFLMQHRRLQVMWFFAEDDIKAHADTFDIAFQAIQDATTEAEFRAADWWNDVKGIGGMGIGLLDVDPN